MQTLDEPTRAARADFAPPAAKPQLTDAPSPAEKARAGGLPSAAAPTLSALAAAALAACGGGGGGDDTSGNKVNLDNDTGTKSNNNPAPGGDNNSNLNTNNGQNPNTNPNTNTNNNNGTSPPPTRPSETEAARFLMQASFGGTYAQVREVQNKGFEKWLDEALNRPWNESTSNYNWFKNHGYFDARTLATQNMGIDNSIWCKLITDPDVLRVRAAYALSQIFVVSMNGLGAIIWRNLAAACYMDLLEKYAFGNYEDLLKTVTLSPAMGTYLNMKGSRKTTGTSAPDENYAREVMQLFSIGLYQLKPDGTFAVAGDKPVETYSQQNVTELAGIFTGWWFGSQDDPAKLDYLNQPMTNDGKFFTQGEKPFFDQKVPASATPQDALNQVLKYLANHQNVGPFIGRQLIQRLVCSNPSTAYVARITKVFNDDGSSNKVRGNLKAVIKAILMDEEARRPDLNQVKAYGKLKEPVYRLAQWGRTFNVNSTKPNALVDWTTSATVPPGPWNMGDLSDDAKGLGQAPMRSPSVFNFYRPGYVPQQGAMSKDSVTAPEFQICNEVTVAAYLNFMKTTIELGRNDIQPDYSADYELAKNPEALVNRYSLLLTAGTLSQTNKNIILDAIAQVKGDRINNTILLGTEAQDRVRATILMIMATPEYMIQK